MTYLQNKYTNTYFRIINNARNRIEFDSYTENHHIIPRSLCGSDSNENLVRLSAREHLICHLLLIRMVEGVYREKMIFAANMMCNASSSKHLGQRIKSRQYSLIKSELSKIQRERMLNSSPERKAKFSKHMLGKHHSDETKDKIRVGNTNKKVSQETKDKISLSNKGRSLSEDHKKKLSISSTNRVCSDETREKISKANIGKTISVKTREKMSKAKIGTQVSKETREKMSKAKLGTKQSKDQIEKKTQSLIERYKDQSLRDKIGNKVSLAKKGKPNGTKGLVRSEETKAKQSAARKLYWENKKRDLEISKSLNLTHDFQDV